MEYWRRIDGSFWTDVDCYPHLRDASKCADAPEVWPTVGLFWTVCYLVTTGKLAHCFIMFLFLVLSQVFTYKRTAAFSVPKAVMKGSSIYNIFKNTSMLYSLNIDVFK